MIFLFCFVFENTAIFNYGQNVNISKVLKWRFMFALFFPFLYETINDFNDSCSSTKWSECCEIHTHTQRTVDVRAYVAHFVRSTFIFVHRISAFRIRNKYIIVYCRFRKWIGVATTLWTNGERICESVVCVCVCMVTRVDLFSATLFSN